MENSRQKKNSQLSECCLLPGGAYRIRTDDPFTASEVLYQLS